MGRQIVKQPDGRYAVWSTVVDGFVLTNATPEDIIEDWVDEYRQNITNEVSNIVAQLEDDGRPYYQFTLTFDECLRIIREIHGSEDTALPKE